MLTPKIIPAEPDRPVSQDYAALRQEALGWLKTWCHETWTDFNESDPGVTILEELCYALTDLGLRTELPIPRLVNLPDGLQPQSSWPENGFYAPEQLFPMEPLTAADYRKLILDECLDVLDAQCAPMSASVTDGVAPIPGRYVVSILFDPDLLAESSTEQGGTDARLSQIKHLLDQHRNLGERFERVEPVPVVRFSLRGRLRLKPGQHESEVIAEAYLAIRAALLPSVQHQSYGELEAQGVSTSEVYTGPLLRHGAISPPAGTQVLPWNEVEYRTRDALKRLPGLTDFSIELVRPESERNDAVRMLSSEFVFTADGSGPERNALTIESAAVEPNLGHQVATLIRSRVRASGRRMEASLARISSQPDGMQSLPGLDVQTFEPIGNGLPAIYGIGPGVVLETANSLRRARAKQLQGYLVVFEQLAADMAAQLAHVRTLFSNRPQHTTEFSQPLYDVPGVFPLLKGFLASAGESSASDRHARESTYQENPANPYWQGLRDLAESPERFRRRRTQFLDHLLARFGESYPAKDPANQETNANKESVLRHMPSLGLSRAVGRATQPKSRPGRSGLEQRIELLLRREDASTSLAPERTENGEERARAFASTGPFYFLIEHLLFLPTLSSGQSSSGPTRRFDFAQFGSRITHVLLNWTVVPLRPALQRFAEELIRTHLGAHLESRFLWFERSAFASQSSTEAAALTYQELIILHEQWRAGGSPALILAAPPDANSLAVYADDVASRLFALLNQAGDTGRIWPET